MEKGPGVPDDFYARLAPCSRARGTRLVVDTFGLPLAAALQAGTTLIKPSLRELREVLRQPLEHPADQCAAAQALVHSGQTEMVALSLGAQGAVLATRDGVWQAPALDVSAASGTTGAGDCFLAALVWSLDRGAPPPEALRWGMAAGAAALLVPGTALARATDVHRLQSQVIVRASPV